jgi:hypothetical protein
LPFDRTEPLETCLYSLCHSRALAKQAAQLWSSGIKDLTTFESVLSNCTPLERYTHLLLCLSVATSLPLPPEFSFVSDQLETFNFASEPHLWPLASFLQSSIVDFPMDIHIGTILQGFGSVSTHNYDTLREIFKLNGITPENAPITLSDVEIAKCVAMMAHTAGDYDKEAWNKFRLEHFLDDSTDSTWDIGVFLTLCEEYVRWFILE